MYVINICFLINRTVFVDYVFYQIVAFYECAQVKGDDTKPGTLIVALTSDRGLCGAVHTNVAKRIRAMLGEVADSSDMKVLCIGDKSRAMLQRSVQILLLD